MASSDTEQAANAPQALTDAQKRAAILLGEDARNDAEIARECGVSRRTLARWKHLPAFDALVQAAYERACVRRLRELDSR